MAKTKAKENVNLHAGSGPVVKRKKMTSNVAFRDREIKPDSEHPMDRASSESFHHGEHVLVPNLKSHNGSEVINLINVYKK